VRLQLVAEKGNVMYTIGDDGVTLFLMGWRSERGSDMAGYSATDGLVHSSEEGLPHEVTMNIGLAKGRH
jgi:hypothetical protein